jgi:hypothetical protein
MFSIDTSALIWGKNTYPTDISPGFWRSLEQGIASGQLKASDAVAFELDRKNDEVYEWAKAQHGFFVPIDGPIQVKVREILRTHPRLLNLHKNKSGADPFVIALAILNDGVVVTQESKRGPGGAPQIPNVCDDMKIDHVDVLGLFRRMKWTI